MYLTKEVKAEIFKKYAGSETNTGSAERKVPSESITLLST